MTKELIKKAYDSAQKEIEEKQIEKVKDIVKDTLLKIKELEDKIKNLEDEKKILKLDLEDLKEGRLDRIEERQEKDGNAKKVSVIKVIKEIHHHTYDRWFEPYKITYVPYTPPIPFNQPIWYTANTGIALGGNATSATTDAVFTLCGSVAKNNVVGTYSIGNKTVHLR